MRPGRLRLLLPCAALLTCGPRAPTGPTAPLVDTDHAPLVLTESARLEMPPAYSGNRFLRGWWPNRRTGSLRQTNVGDRVVFEAVFLDGRERRLSTRLDVVEADPGATFGVQVAGIELPPRTLVPNVEVPLPADLPLGRLPIELDLRGARVIISSAGFGHAWRPGRVELADEVIVQESYSAIDFLRRLAGPATLVGRFEPPDQPEDDQRFAVLVETDAAGSGVAFEWQPGRRSHRLRVDLPHGYVRIRLLAQGLGPPGRWLAMAITGAADPVVDPVETGLSEGRVGTVYSVSSDRFKLSRAQGLGRATDVTTSRDAEYVFDLRRDPEESRNLAGIRSVEVDWLRARLEAWLARNPAS